MKRFPIALFLLAPFSAFAGSPPVSAGDTAYFHQSSDGYRHISLLQADGTFYDVLPTTFMALSERLSVPSCPRAGRL